MMFALRRLGWIEMVIRGLFEKRTELSEQAELS